MRYLPLHWVVGRDSCGIEQVELECGHTDDSEDRAWAGFIRCYMRKEDKEISLQNAQDNANFIVDAVNNHYFLIEALANLIKECDNDSGGKIETSESYQKAVQLLNKLRKEK